MSVIFTGIRATSLDDFEAVYSWIQRMHIEPDSWIGISFADRPRVVASGNVVFSTNPSFSDGFKWNEHTRRSLERKGGRILWVVSGLQNEGIKRYSMILVHNSQRCSLVAYLLDGDSLPSAALKLSPPSPSKERLPSITSDTSSSQSRKKPPKLSLSAMEHIKSVVEALAVELGTDLNMLIPIILELFQESHLDGSSRHHTHHNSHVSTLNGADLCHYVESTHSSGLRNVPGSGHGIGSAVPLSARSANANHLTSIDSDIQCPSNHAGSSATTSDTQSTYISRFPSCEGITNLNLGQHDSEYLESLRFNSGAGETGFGSVDSDPGYAGHASFTTTDNLTAQITHDSLSSLSCEGITNPYQHGLQNMDLNSGAGENIFSPADLDPRVPGYVGYAPTTSDSRLMYDSQYLLPYEGTTNLDQLSLQYIEWLRLHNLNTVGLHHTTYSGYDPASGFDSYAASGQ